MGICVGGVRCYGFYSAGDKPVPRGLQSKQQVHLCLAVTKELFRVAWAMCDVLSVSQSPQCALSLFMPAQHTLTGTEENGASGCRCWRVMLARHLVSGIILWWMVHSVIQLCLITWKVRTYKVGAGALCWHACKRHHCLPCMRLRVWQGPFDAVSWPNAPRIFGLGLMPTGFNACWARVSHVYTRLLWHPVQAGTTLAWTFAAVVAGDTAWLYHAMHKALWPAGLPWNSALYTLCQRRWQHEL